MKHLIFILFTTISIVASSQGIIENHIYIPNSFVVDGDGYYDGWKTYSDVEWDSFNLEIYNVWGDLIWFSDDPLKWWDGRSGVDSQYYGNLGTYYYKIKYGIGDVNEEKKGVIYMIR